MNRDLNTLNDEELVKLINSGCSEAEEILFHRYKNCVRSKARTYFLIGADSDDIVQEGMIGLYKAVRDFNPNKNISFKTFAELCITRQILTAIRTANRNKHSPLNAYISINSPAFGDDSDTTFSGIISNNRISNPEDIYILEETMKEQRLEISKKLSSFEKSVLDCYIEGCSYDEISVRLDKSTKSIDNALQRIKKKLVGFIHNN